MRRMIMTVAATAVLVVLSATAASAAPHHTHLGTRGPDRLVGTGRDDILGGRGGDDIIRPNNGADIVRGGPGDDKIYLYNDGDVDRIHCGDGFDVVAYHYSVDQHDIIDANCEGVIA